MVSKSRDYSVSKSRDYSSTIGDEYSFYYNALKQSDMADVFKTPSADHDIENSLEDKEISFFGKSSFGKPQRTNEYGLAAHTNSMPSSTSIWTVEGNCWALVNDLLCIRKEHFLDSEFDPSYGNVDENIFKSDAKIVEESLHSAKYYHLKEALVVKEWLEKIVPSEEKSDFNSPSPLGMNPKGFNDPDYRYRLNPSSDHLAHEKSLNANIFKEFRKGDLDLAIQLCRETNQRWKAASLQGGKLYHDSLIDTCSNQETILDVLVGGNQNLIAWKATCYALAREESNDVWEKALYAALSGDLNGVLPVCISWNDFLWAHYNSLIETKLMQIVYQNSSGLFLVDEIDLATPLASKSEREIFESLEMHENAEISNLSKSPFHQFLKHFVLNSLGEFFSNFNNELTCRLESSSIDENFKHAVRFVSHVILLLRSLDFDDFTSQTDEILLNYVNLLIIEQKGNLIAPYLAYLPVTMQISGYVSFLTGVFSDRKEFYQLGKSNSLDMARICCQVVENMFTSSNVLVKTVFSNVALAGLDDDELFEEHLVLIKSLEWLTFDVAQKGDFLRFSNRLARFFLGNGFINSVKEMFKIFPIARTSTNVGDFNTELDELTQYAALIDCFNRFNDWSKLNLEKDKADNHETIIRESSAAVDRIEKLIQGPLFGGGGDSESQDDIDWRQEIDVINALYIPHLVQAMHSILYKTKNLIPGNLKASLQIAELVAENQQTYTAFVTSKKMPILLDLLQKSSRELLK